MRVLALFFTVCCFTPSFVEAHDPPETVFIAVDTAPHQSILRGHSPTPASGACHCCGDPAELEEDFERVAAAIDQVQSDGSLAEVDRRARLKPLLKDVVHLVGHLTDRHNWGKAWYSRLVSWGINMVLSAVHPWRTVLNARRVIGIHQSNPNFGTHIPNILIMVGVTETLEQTSFVWLPALASAEFGVESGPALAALSSLGFLANRLDVLCHLNPFIYVGFPPLQRWLTGVRRAFHATVGRAYRVVTWDRVALLQGYERDLRVEDIGGEGRRFQVSDRSSGAEAILVREGDRTYVESFRVSGRDTAEVRERGRYLAEQLGWNASDAIGRALGQEQKPFYVASVEKPGEGSGYHVTFRPHAIALSRTWFRPRPPCGAALERG